MIKMHHFYLCLLKRMCEVEIYTEVKPSTGKFTYMERLREKNKGQQNIEDDGQYSESGDETINDIHFEDTEKERMHDFDEDFDEEFSFGLDEGGHRREDVDGSSTNEPSNLSFATKEMEKECVIEEDYMIDELDSVANEDSCEGMPLAIRFNEEEEEMTKDFTFKVGIKFSSLKQFKKAILEYTILNGREIIFSKNDAMI